MQKNLYCKILALGIVVLFFGISFSLSLIAENNMVSIDDNLIEYTVEIYGIKGLKNHGVILTKEQANDLEELINNIKFKLNNAETKDETITIFNEAVVELDKFNLLPEDITVEKAQELVQGYHQDFKIRKLIDKLFNTGKLSLDQVGNKFCLISGETTNTFFVSVPSVIISWILFIMAMGIPFIPVIIKFILSLIEILCNIINPVNFYNLIGLGHMHDFPNYSYAEGWVYTNGLNGKITWNGTLYGNLSNGLFSMFWLFWLRDWYNTGVFGFSGIKIFRWEKPYKHYYLGFAQLVGISYHEDEK